MCEPATMTAITTAIGGAMASAASAASAVAASVGTAATAAAGAAATIAPYASLLSTAVGVAGAISQGQFQKNLYQRNAEQARLLAADAVERGFQKSTDVRVKSGRMQAEQEVGIAARNIDISSYMAQDIIGSTALFGEIDARTVEENATRERDTYLNQAAQMTAEADAAEQSSYFKAAGGLLSGVANFGTKFPDFFGSTASAAHHAAPGYTPTYTPLK